MTLDDFHYVLQQVFEWENAHMHQFRVPRRDHEHRFRPMGMAGLPSADSDYEPEDRASLGGQLVDVGDELFYDYDFGDGWCVRVVAEEFDPDTFDDEGVVVLDGSGTAPLEDVGGVWGWSEFLAAVNDPQHNRHDELMEWAGLEPGERIDPTFFDAAAANRRLSRR